MSQEVLDVLQKEVYQDFKQILNQVSIGKATLRNQLRKLHLRGLIERKEKRATTGISKTCYRLKGYDTKVQATLIELQRWANTKTINIQTLALAKLITSVEELTASLSPSPTKKKDQKRTIKKSGETNGNKKNTKTT